MLPPPKTRTRIPPEICRVLKHVMFFSCGGYETDTDYSASEDNETDCDSSSSEDERSTASSDGSGDVSIH